MRNMPRCRRGYALALVLVFVLLFLSLLGVAYRHLAASLRVESACVAQAQRDEGAVRAAARAVTLLETGLPPTSPYVGGLTLNTPAGPRSYTITFTAEGGNNWSIQVTPTPSGQSVPSLPITFAGQSG